MVDWYVMEVGCGVGGNLLDLLCIGLLFVYLIGIELLFECLVVVWVVLLFSVWLFSGDVFVVEIVLVS